MTMRNLITAVLLTSTAILPAIAQQNPYNLIKQTKAEKFVVTKSSSAIELASSKTYDKYIISVSGANGYSFSKESNSPSLSMYDLKLPNDGTYNYEIKAVRHVAEIKDTMNNGRSADAVGKLSIVNVSSGKFTSQNGEMMVSEKMTEPRINQLPISTHTNHTK